MEAQGINTDILLLPSQQQLLIRIRHLVSMDSNLVLVSGPMGAGKSTLASVLLEQFGSDFQHAWLTCHPRHSDVDIRDGMLKQLFPAGTFSSEDSLEDSLIHLNADESRHWLIVINHAERLTNQLLVELWGLVESCKAKGPEQQHVGVILFAEPEWASKIARELTDIVQADQPLLTISPLNMDERKVLFNRLAERLPDAVAFDQDIEEELMRINGWPGEVETVLLHHSGPEVITEQKQKNDAPKRSFPINWRWLAAGTVVIGLLFIGLIIYGVENDRSQATEPGTRASIDIESAEDSQPDALISEWEEPVDKLPQPVRKDTLSVGQPIDKEQTRVVVTDTKINQLTAEKYIDKVADDTVTSPKTEPSSVIVEEQSSEDEISEAAAPIKQESIATAPKVEAHPVFRADPSHFTLQLVVLKDQAAMQAFAAKHGLQGDSKFNSYVSVRYGKPVVIGIYGDFPTKEQAKASVNTLTKALAQSGPWPRSYADIQKELH